MRVIFGILSALTLVKCHHILEYMFFSYRAGSVYVCVSCIVLQDELPPPLQTGLREITLLDWE